MMRQRLGMNLSRNAGRSSVVARPGHGNQLRGACVAHWEMDSYNYYTGTWYYYPNIHTGILVEGLFYDNALGGVSLGAGKIRSATTLDLASLSTVLGSPADFHRGSFSFAGWYRLTVDPGASTDPWPDSGACILCREDDFHLVVCNDKIYFGARVWAYVSGSWGNWWLKVNVARSGWDSNWHFFVCGYRPNSYTYLRIDNESVYWQNPPWPVETLRSANSNPLYVGRYFDAGLSPNDGMYFIGQLDEISFFSRCIETAEANFLYNSGAGLSYPWDMGAHLMENLNGEYRILTEDGKVIIGK